MLKLSQFQFGTERIFEFVVYTENGSKNRSGSYKDRSEAKVVKHFANKRLGERCVVYLLKLYYSQLPEHNGDERFYFQPKEAKPRLDLDGPWFKKQHVGRNTLSKMVGSMCDEAGIERKTNHSLRATETTRMFKAGVPEKLIQQRTGHRSVDSLCVYERASAEQQEAVSEILSTTESINYKSALGFTPKSVPVKPPGFPAGDGGFEFTSYQGCTFNFYNR